MDWGFLVGFVLGSAVLLGYHMHYLYKMCTSSADKYADARSTMLLAMLEFGELREVKKSEEE